MAEARRSPYRLYSLAIATIRCISAASSSATRGG